MRPLIALLAVIAILAALVAWPAIDIAVSGWFYQPGWAFSSPTSRRLSSCI